MPKVRLWDITGFLLSPHIISESEGFMLEVVKRHLEDVIKEKICYNMHIVKRKRGKEKWIL